MNDKSPGLSQRAAEEHQGQANYLIRFVSPSVSSFSLPPSFPLQMGDTQDAEVTILSAFGSLMRNLNTNETFATAGQLIQH